ncbi:MAG: trypsin-like serine peptidase [Candidatus Promineifilaceae bacterium]
MPRSAFPYRTLFLLISLLVLLSIFSPSLRAQDGCTPTPDDPYGLLCLVEFISAPNPPQSVARFGDQLSVRVIGKGELADPPRDDGFRGEDTARGVPDPVERPVDKVPSEGQVYHVFNTGNLWEYEVTMGPKMLEDIHTQRDAMGETQATEPVENPQSLELLLRLFLPFAANDTSSSTARTGWSNGSDSRIIRTPTTLWPWRAIAQFSSTGGSDPDNSNCTGTLIGPRHLITAAHCINRMGTNVWYTFDVAPGRNGVSTLPYGESVIDPNPDPGDPVRWYWTQSEWRTQCEDATTATTAEKLACSKWDIGLIVIPDRLGDLTGWMGYVARPAGALNVEDNLNRGYPKCAGFSNQPANCQKARLYGHTGLCSMGDYLEPLSNGWNRIIRNSCDLSAGHSGSAVYHYWDPPQIPGSATYPVVAMVEVWEHCQVCDEDDDYPNRARRITPGVLNVISWLRETFP